jgi:DNA mismatch endonuclease, patch repair protein
VFVDGCFWHGCPNHGNTPKANMDYWAPKLARNQERDRCVTAALRAANWTVVRVWEHEPVPRAVGRILDALAL